MSSSLHIRRNDQVLVTRGKDRGKQGKVLRVIPSRNRAIVERINMIKRHTRPNPNQNIKGGLVEREASIHLSNLMVICGECSQAARSHHKTLADGRKVRICQKCEGVIDK
jgi:large subunit ribosomal protein L24